VIPLPTTTITLLAPVPPEDQEDDWGTGPDPASGFTAVASGVRAHLSSRMNIATPSAFGQFTSGGNTQQLKFRMICDPCELTPDMRVLDETTGEEYDVAWVMPRPEPMSHIVSSVTRSIGTP
jgi:hypothetical protein